MIWRGAGKDKFAGVEGMSWMLSEEEGGMVICQSIECDDAELGAAAVA